GAAAGGKESDAEAKGTAGSAASPPPRGSATAGSYNAAAADDAVEDVAKPEVSPEAHPLAVQAVEVIAALMRRIRGVATPPEKAPDYAVEAKAALEELLKLSLVTIRLPEEREVKLPLEAGMTDGHVARLKGQGLKVQGMQRGD